jgi:hypothetical protein
MNDDIYKESLKIILKIKLFRIKHTDLTSLIDKRSSINYDSVGISYVSCYKMLGRTYDHTFQIINEDLFLEFYKQENLEIYPL